MGLFETHGLQPTRLLIPWDFPGKNIGMGCHFLLQGIFPVQGCNLGSPAFQADSLLSEPPGKPRSASNILTKYVPSYFIPPFLVLMFPSRDCFFLYIMHIQHFLEMYFLSSQFFAQMVKYSMYYSTLLLLKNMSWRACQISRKLHFFLLAKQHLTRVPSFAGHFKWLLPIFCNYNVAVSHLVSQNCNRYHSWGDCPTVELPGQRVSGWH